MVDGVYVVDQAIQHGIGQGRILHSLAPSFDGPLAGEDGGTVEMSVVEDFDQILLLVPVDGRECPIVQYQDMNARVLL